MNVTPGVDLVERARAIAPLIAGEADEIERTRRLTPDVVAALIENGLYRALLPQSLGGAEVPIDAFMACGFRIVAAGDADAQRVFEARAFSEQIGGLAVDLGILLVPENVAAFGIENHDALRQQVDGLAQPLMRFARLDDGRFGLRAALHEFVVFGGPKRGAREARLARRPAARSTHVALSLS